MTLVCNVTNLSTELCIFIRYEMVFKQAVTSEDMYLQMTGKNTSTASCEDLVVRMKKSSRF